MGSSLRAGVRIGAVGLFTAVTATLVLPGAAGAEETTPRVVTGQCPATVGDQDGTPVTLDAGALLDQPGVLTVGLGNDAKGTGEQDDPTLALPAAEAVDALGVNEVTVVRDAATGLCTFAKPVVNETNAVLRGKPLADEKPDDGEQPGEPPEDPPGEDPGDQPPGDEPGEQPDNGGVNGPVETNPGINPGADLRAPIDSFGPLGPIIGPPAAAIPPVAPPMPPGAGLPDPGKLPDVRAQDSGTAEAMPQASPPARLPLLFAVLALAIVAALLVRSWLRRRTTS